jgi:hypothetical protein
MLLGVCDGAGADASETVDRLDESRPVDLARTGRHGNREQRSTERECDSDFHSREAAPPARTSSAWQKLHPLVCTM